MGQTIFELCRDYVREHPEALALDNFEQLLDRVNINELLKEMPVDLIVESMTAQQRQRLRRKLAAEMPSLQSQKRNGR